QTDRSRRCGTRLAHIPPRFRYAEVPFQGPGPAPSRLPLPRGALARAEEDGDGRLRSATATQPWRTPITARSQAPPVAASESWTGAAQLADPLFAGRRRVKRLTGSYKVPTLVLDDGTVI